jgi:putative flippase GtrA
VVFNPQQLRFIVNGVFATAVHYSVLVVAMEILAAGSAGLANLSASVFGITSSFLGNRYFVFRSTVEPILLQGLKFSGLYALIAVLNGAVLYLLTDRLGYHYNLGFLVALCLQVWLGYTGGKHLVFRKQSA